MDTPAPAPSAPLSSSVVEWLDRPPLVLPPMRPPSETPLPPPPPQTSSSSSSSSSSLSYFQTAPHSPPPPPSSSSISEDATVVTAFATPVVCPLAFRPLTQRRPLAFRTALLVKAVNGFFPVNFWVQLGAREIEMTWDHTSDLRYIVLTSPRSHTIRSVLKRLIAYNAQNPHCRCCIVSILEAIPLKTFAPTNLIAERVFTARANQDRFPYYNWTFRPAPHPSAASSIITSSSSTAAAAAFPSAALPPPPPPPPIPPSAHLPDRQHPRCHAIKTKPQQLAQSPPPSPPPPVAPMRMKMLLPAVEAHTELATSSTSCMSATSSGVMIHLNHTIHIPIPVMRDALAAMGLPGTPP